MDSLGFFVESFRGFEEESFGYNSYQKFDQIESKRPEDKSVDVFEPEPYRAVELDQYDYLAEFNPSIDLLSAVPIDEPISVPVPDLPIWTEPFSSFSSTNPSILSDMFEFIKQLPGVVETRCLLPKTHRIECSVYINNASATFQVNLYKGKSEGQFVVELQRISGCCFAARKVVNQILAKFGKQKQGKKFVARDMEFVDDCLSMTPELAEILLSMIQASAGSEGSDPREGFRLLCEVTGNRNSHPILLQACKGVDKLADIIKSGINSGDVETERYACIVLANLCCGGSGQCDLDAVSKFQSEVQKQVVELFENLSQVLIDDNGSLGRDEAKRQVLRCVNSLSPDLDKAVKAKHGKICRNLSAARLGELSESAKASFARFLEVQ